jgi:hypothetical protein
MEMFHNGMVHVPRECPRIHHLPINTNIKILYTLRSTGSCRTTATAPCIIIIIKRILKENLQHILIRSIAGRWIFYCAMVRMATIVIIIIGYFIVRLRWGRLYPITSHWWWCRRHYTTSHRMGRMVVVVCSRTLVIRIVTTRPGTHAATLPLLLLRTMSRTNNTMQPPIPGTAPMKRGRIRSYGGHDVCRIHDPCRNQ